MASNFENGVDQQLEEEYYDQDEDDLSDFIVGSDDEDDLVKKKQHHREEEVEEEVEIEEEEEEEEEEIPVGQQEILSLREQLKAKIRKKNAAMAAGAGKASCSLSMDRTAAPVNDGYGTFFGPSKPMLARRVIEDGCASMIKELHSLPPSRKDVHLVSKAQPGAKEILQQPKLKKRKVDTLRENRDYSSILSDDADTPPPKKEQPGNRPLVVPKSATVQVRAPANSAGKSSLSTGQPACVQSIAGKKTMSAARRNGSNMPNMKRIPGLHSSSNGQKLQSSLKSKQPQAQVTGQRLQKQPQAQRLQSNGRQAPLQVQRSGHNGSAEHGRLKSAQKQASRPVEKRVVKRKSDEEGSEDYSSMIRKMFNYKPEKYVGRDYEDDLGMEADFASIEKEERNSARAAKLEDAEQLRLIEEEERREREKKRKKLAPKQ